MDRDHHIVIVGGCGHVGLPLGVVLAAFGDAQVTLLDIDAGKVDTINQGRMPFLEQGGERQSSTRLPMSQGQLENSQCPVRLSLCGRKPNRELCAGLHVPALTAGLILNCSNTD